MTDTLVLSFAMATNHRHCEERSDEAIVIAKRSDEAIVIARSAATKQSSLRGTQRRSNRHCEERSDEAIQTKQSTRITIRTLIPRAV
jgi:hypothetical protein